MKSKVDLSEDNILIIAAEASSTMYAKNFIKSWKNQFPESHFYGVGDKEMAEQGVECLGFAEDMAVVGYLEVLKHYSAIKTVADNILDKTKEKKPKFALLLDYPGFNLRLAKKLKKMGIPVVYYISPQLWAWKKGRVKQVQDYVDEMLVVFPFEVDFYKEYGVKAHFVGHPLLEVVNSELNIASKNNADITLGLMPGSRNSEIEFNLKVQLEAAKLIQEKHRVKVKLLLAPTLAKKDIEPMINEQLNVEIIQGPPTEMISQCDYILSASGTATLQVALCEKPMVVMYRMNPVTAFFAKRLVKTVDSFCIVNLVAEEKIVPELFQEQASPENLSQEVSALIENKEKREKMISGLKGIKNKLGQGVATENVVNFLKQRFYS